MYIFNAVYYAFFLLLMINIYILFSGRPVVQEAAAISACHLSRSDFSACVNMLRKWTPKNGEVSRNVIETMKYFICKKKPVWWQKVLSGCIKIPDVLVL